ncbi:MAG: hypothetical protein Q4G03_08475 [Planctomycetia bacterium]|nr:hypothetical protein [Planctomycetia bacterium]
MKAKLSLVLLSALALLGAVSVTQADDGALGAPAAAVDNAIATATQSAPVVANGCPECSECADAGFIGRGVGLRGGYGVGFPGRGGFGARPGFGDRIRQSIADDRPIVEASPFANPNGQDWERFRYYPYGYYPHNFNSVPNMSVPKYHPGYQNYYPVPRRYHEGKHFNLDVF